MNFSAPMADVIPGPRAAILATLMRLRQPVTGRELAAQASVSQATARRIIDDLERAGLVNLTPAGRAVVVELNRRHLAVPALERLAAMRAGLVERLRTAIGEWPQPAMAGWLFGSAARGDGDRRSDVDLAVVARREPSAAWEEQIGHLADLVAANTGNTAQIVDYSRRTFQQLVTDANPLIRSLHAEGIELIDGSNMLLRPW